MRETKFRGKRKDNEEWVYGSLWIKKRANTSWKKHYIWTLDTKWYEVVPETVGQFVCKDKKAKDAFAGDKVKVWYEFSVGRYEAEEGILRWDEREMMWMVNRHRVHNLHSDTKGNFTNIEVIGTVAENKELLETKAL